MQEIILYPTDTVYGLGVDARDREAVARLRTLKGGGGEKHYSVAVRDAAMMREYAVVTPLAERLAESFLPGKLTLILQAKVGLEPVHAEDGSVGIRIPNYTLPFEYPITATSANVSGQPTLKTPEEILAQFGEQASMITRVINAGALPPSAPSTVVDARGEHPILIREGAIPWSELQNF